MKGHRRLTPPVYLCHEPLLQRWVRVHSSLGTVFIDWRWPRVTKAQRAVVCKVKGRTRL